MKTIPENIVRLILTSQKRKLKVDEAVLLREWLNSSPENKSEAQNLRELFEDFTLVEQYQSVNIDKAWQKVKKKTAVKPNWNRRFFILSWKAVAAILLPLIIVSSIFYFKPFTEKNNLAFDNIKPGSEKAILQLARGEKIFLTNDRLLTIINNHGVTIGVNKTNTLICSKVESDFEELNSLSVPVGGEYRVELCDGTKIAVNSGSQLKYPYAFEPNQRVVELEGEAYFEVTKDPERPFTVKTAHASVKVLGTKFNISSYKSDDFERITLEEGSVEATYNNEKYKLAPGMQLKIDLKNNTAFVNIVDTRLFTSWKDGMFRFQNMKLEDLAVKMQRWYNVDFQFKDESCKSYRFTGAIERNANFKDFIRLIESTTGVKFEQKEDVITISKK